MCPLPVSKNHEALLNSKTVTLYFKQDATSTKALNFSLTESILQISSTIFTISNLPIDSFSEVNEDVFFLMYNVMNDFYVSLEQSAQYYVLELFDRSETRKELGLILYLLALAVIVICLLILIPVVQNVNSQKDKVLRLFCEIDNGVITMLAVKCEKFITSLNIEEGNDDDMQSHEDLEIAYQNE